MVKNNLLIAWLQDARSMEKALADFSDKAVGNFDGKTEIQERLRGFRERCLQAEAEMDTSLEALNESTSDSKDLMGKVVGYVTGAGSELYRDSKVKDVLVMHGAFHFAHASYASLAHGAKTCGEQTLALLCDRLAKEREGMATWVAGIIPMTTESALQQGEKK